MRTDDTPSIQQYLKVAEQDLVRQRRLSIQYAGAAFLLAVASVVLQIPWLSFAICAVFVIWLWLRIRAAQARLTQIRAQLADTSDNTRP